MDRLQTSSFHEHKVVRSIKSKYQGLTSKHNTNGWTAVFLHYSADPDKTDAWRDKEIKKYPNVDIWNQEHEIDFSKTLGLRVYTEFDQEIHVSPVPLLVNKSETLYRGWDFGYRHPVCVWAQVVDGQLR